MTENALALFCIVALKGSRMNRIELALSNGVAAFVPSIGKMDATPHGGGTGHDGSEPISLC